LAYVDLHRLSPDRPGASQDIQGGIVIPMKRQATSRTVMPANRKVFLDLSAALAALASLVGRSSVEVGQEGNALAVRLQVAGAPGDVAVARRLQASQGALRPGRSSVRC